MGLLAAPPAPAQFINNQCATVQGGMCLVNPAPVGSPCGCFTPVGPVPGNVMPPGGGYANNQAVMLSTVCSSFKGMCSIPFPAGVGSGCNCSGIPGTVIPR